MLRAAVRQIFDENERVNGALGLEDSSERIVGSIEGELALYGVDMDMSLPQQSSWDIVGIPAGGDVLETVGPVMSVPEQSRMSIPGEFPRLFNSSGSELMGRSQCF